ncbi:hypothetical protein [Rhodoblastus acidophilus]|uniref:hypothetical protein n=1 Tax=Rhodoblastus acidophilus TaxID=1074 RepID=UPI001131E4EC|nr:hypothetical protein [Rhodoblastus acidophilus]
MSTVELYGVETHSILEAKKLIESLLSVVLEERFSSFYRGGTYLYYEGMREESLKIVINLDPYDDEPLEEAYPYVNIIMYVKSSNRFSDLPRILTNAPSGVIKLLRRETSCE